MMWFDHVGGRDWGKWRFDELFAMMYRLQPKLLVNDRAARFCGPKSPEDRGPASPEIKKMTDGDFYTPEGRIGSMDIARDWESCIHVGQGWSYRGEDGFKGPEDCIKMLVSCTTGGGNLLLNFGPRPDGTFAEGEAKVARAMGEWLKKYGAAIYGTRGGPYRNGSWGGSCHKGDKLFLHVYQWQPRGLAFDALPYKVKSARTLTGAAGPVHADDQRVHRPGRRRRPRHAGDGHRTDARPTRRRRSHHRQRPRGSREHGGVRQGAQRKRHAGTQLRLRPRPRRRSRALVQGREGRARLRLPYRRRKESVGED